MSTEHILIIDDSIAISSLLANEILPLGGYRATAALSGEEGLDIARQLQPDLILCDLEMPGINGLEVARALKDQGHDVPMIMMTAFGSEAVAAQALRLGVKDYIIKPFTTEEILAAVERALTESRLLQKLNGLQAMLEEQRQALIVIQAISQAAGSGLDPDAFLSRIVLAAVYSGKALGGYLAWLNPQTEQLDVKTAVNLPGVKGKEVDRQSDAAIEQALSSGKAASSKDERGHWTYLPLMRHQAPLGLMAIVSQASNSQPHTTHLLTTLAGFAAFSLENSQLRSELAVAMLQSKP